MIVRTTFKKVLFPHDLLMVTFRSFSSKDYVWKALNSSSAYAVSLGYLTVIWENSVHYLTRFVT